MDIEYFKKIKIEEMKAKNKDAVNALNVLISKLMLSQIEKRAAGSELSDADVVSILQKTEKELIEERDTFLKANRPESVATLNNQIAAIQKHIPKLMSVEDIKKIILEMPDRSIGNVMKKFKTEYAGKVDMRAVNEVLKSL